MIRQTFLRLKGLVTPSQVWVIAGADHVRRIRRQLPELDRQRIIGEPCARSTAPCVALAAFLMRDQPDAVMFVLPSDHAIRNRRQFQRSLKAAAQVALHHNALVTFGITPTSAATGYGYLELEEDAGRVDGVLYHRLRCFVEKPDQATAESYVAGGRFLWNSGMFAWKVSTILDSLRRHLPETYRRLESVDWAHRKRAAAQLARIYPTLPNASVDYAIM